MAKKVDTRELGLVLGTRLLKTKDLHLGMWENGLDVTVQNLPAAQRRYTEHLLERIPAGVKTVLDVGCGTGGVAELLSQHGYHVQCISPSPELTRMARARLGNGTVVHETTFERFDSDQRFDLVLFSESFQYIPLSESLPRAIKFGIPRGHVLISDFFRSGAPGRSALRGGHDLKRFYDVLAGQPLDVVSDEDITAQTAPNLDLMDGLITDYAEPFYEAFGYYLRNNHPWLAALGRRIFRKRLERLEFHYFSHQRNGEAFRVHKCYRTLLLQKREGA